MLNISFLAMVFYGFAVFQNVAGEETGKSCRHGYIPCGNDLCCCSRDLAYCEGHGKRLPYIPKLPNRTRSFDFGNNFLQTLSREVFDNISTLEIKYLYLKIDHIVNITEDAFTDIGQLTRLDLSSNNNINKSQLSLSFGSLPDLQVLNLQSIGLNNTIPIDLFKRLGNASVTKLVLDRNEIKYVNISVFKYLPHLEHLSLANNRIHNFYANDGHPRLKTLLLTKNEITQHPPLFCPTNYSVFPVLQNLFLDNNYISNFSHDAWKCLDSLNHLVIGGNVAREIPKNVIIHLTSLNEFRVNGMLGSKSESLRIDTSAFNSTSLRRLDLSSNNIKYTKKHLEYNVFEGCRGLTYLDISQNNLNQLGDDEITQLFSPLTKLQKLYMVSMRLRSFPRNLFTNFTDLAFLNVDGNGIQDIGDAFIGLTKLRYLTAQGNNIRVLKPQSFPENIRKTLTTLNLADNSLECGCENLWFRTWLGDQGKPAGTNISLTSWPERYICHTPSGWNGKPFKTFRPTKASCETKHIILIICVSLGSVLLIISVTIPVCLRYKWHIQYMRYKLSKRPEQDPERMVLLGDTGYPVEPYIYVIYHDDDSQFVHHDICDLIENKLGLKLYIWHRDAPLGSKATIMFDAIHSSTHVLAILSNNFVTDGWCEFQLNVGLVKTNENRKDCLTLLVLEGLDCSLLRRSWCVTLVRNATVYWCSDQQSIKTKLCRDQLATRLAGNGI